MITVILANYCQFLDFSPFKIPTAKAALPELDLPIVNITPPKEDTKEMGLIAILVDNDLLEGNIYHNKTTLKDGIFAYAENIQTRIPYSQAFVVGIDPNEDTRKISTILEKMYYEGVDSNLLDNNSFNDNGNSIEDNKLIGVVLVGDVPIPVVKEKSGAFTPSMYPYTDFYRKRYIYDHNTGHFEFNEKSLEANPEVWHGVILPPSKDQNKAHEELSSFFDKNNKYSNNLDDYNNFEKRLMYVNFPAMEKQANKMDYFSYKHYLTYMEEIVFNRYNKHLLKHLIDQVSGEISPDTKPEDRTPPISDSAMENMTDWSTKMIFEQYTKPFVQAFKIYRGRVNDQLSETGRWNSADIDTPESLISLRDEYARIILKTRQIELEKETDQVIKNETKNEKEDFTGISRMKITLNLLGNDQESNFFDFYGYIDGQKIVNVGTGGLTQAVNTEQMCGFYLGQRKAGDESLLQNNSVYTEANRTYDLVNHEETMILEKNYKEKEEYKDYAGCVSNNALKVINDEVDLNPEYCDPAQAKLPVFDLAGSKEVPNNISEYKGLEGCEDRINFYLEDEDQYKKKGAEGTIIGIISYGVSLSQVIKDAYSEMVKKEMVEEIEDATIRQKTSAVVKSLGKNGGFEYSGGHKIIIKLNTESFPVKIDPIITHKEPTEATLTAKSLSTPSIPADAIRYIEFKKDTNKKFQYLNLFKILGSNPQEITENLLRKISEKDGEIREKLGNENIKLALEFLKEHSSNVDWDLFNESDLEDKINELGTKSDLVDSVVWRALSADQKLKNIIPKYLDSGENIILPAEFPDDAILTAPKVRPKGYEVLHIVADGDAYGYNFGLNRKFASKALSKKEDAEKLLSNQNTDDDDSENEEEWSFDDETSYICGDPKGVEIWEWPASIGCWIKTEILPAADLFSLDGACGSLPSPEEDEEEEYINALDDDSQDLYYFTVSMAKKSLVPDESAEIYIYPKNNKDEEIVGYTPEKAHLELSNTNIGEFKQNDINIFGGEGKIEFIAKNPGSGTITITMGDADPETITINVYESIKINLISSGPKILDTGKIYYEIKAVLKNPEGNSITDTKVNIVLKTERKSDGKFENGGIAHISPANIARTINFWPSPIAEKVNIIASNPFYTQITDTIDIPARKAVGLLIKSPKSIVLDETTEIPIIAISATGGIAEGFNGVVDLKIDDITAEYGELLDSKISIIDGKGIAQIKTRKETGVIKLIAEHPNLNSGMVTMDVLARIDSNIWGDINSQNLFASFVGFPAGNFIEENYFAGMHLFNGKTQATFAFVNDPSKTPEVFIEPNYKINADQQAYKVEAQFIDNKLSLEVINNKSLKPIIYTQIPLLFDSIGEWKDNKKPSERTAYFEILDEKHYIEQLNEEFIIMNRFDKPVLQIFNNKVEILNNNYQFIYNQASEFEGIDLIFTDGIKEIGSLKLSFKKININTSQLNIDDDYILQKTASGRSTNDPYGIAIYDPNAETEKEAVNEFYGFEGDGDYLNLFASGMPIGDAVRFDMPSNAMLFGDPTIKLKTKSNSTLNYDSSAGRKIFKDPSGEQILSITNFNFNNDKHEDLALVMQSGRIRYLQGGTTEPLYRDRGDIAFLADEAVAIESFDFKNDGYEDLLVATKEGRLAIMHNNQEQITRTNQKIKVGKQIYTLLKGDMDKDGYEDLVILDSRGDIKIFYYNPETNSFPENGKQIANYGFSLQLDQNLNSSLKIRYPGLDQKFGIGPSQTTSNQVILDEKTVDNVFSSFAQKPTEDFDGEFKTLSDDELKKAQDEILKELSNQENLSKNTKESTSENDPDKLPWPEQSSGQTETVFEKMNDLSFISSTKTVINKERPSDANLDLEENLLYEIKIKSSKSINNVVIADTIPDALSLNTKAVKCNGSGCSNMKSTQTDILLFISGINLHANQEITITYEASVLHTPKAIILLDNLNIPGFNDDQLDILVSPPYNDTGELIQHYSTGKRTYAVRTTDSDNEEKFDPYENIIDLRGLDLNGLEKNPENAPDPSTLFPNGENEKAMDFMEESDCEGIECLNDGLDSIMDAINNFACMGGGCFPMPVNMAFLVPPKMAFPIFAFPTTLPTPAGAMPFIWPPMFMGASNVPGVHNSMLRLYLSPTLTGGLGVAMCWNLYAGSAAAPVPLAPIPYPPPIGNCMVVALPMSEAAPCKAMAGVMDDLVSIIRSATNKLNKITAVINSAGNGGGGSSMDESSGGLEVSLAVNLGDKQKFSPPAKGFTNLKLPTMDSIGGVISDWVDRQTIEIMTKLMRFPTIYLALPEISKMFTLDKDMMLRKVEIFKENINGGKKVGEDEKDEDKIVEGMKKVTDALQEVENRTLVNSNDLLKNLYDVVDAVPFVKIEEVYLDFKIPWVSPAEINRWILDANKWIIFEKREINRFLTGLGCNGDVFQLGFEEWSKTCPVVNCIDDKTGEQIGNCFHAEAVTKFLLDFTETIKSIEDNITVLQSYLAFPKKFIKFKTQLVDYVRVIACYIEQISNMLGGWIAEIKEDIISWAEVYFVIKEIIKNYKKLFDLFIDFDSSCSICTNERNAFYGFWQLLGLIIPKIPIITFPKIPDIVFDMSDIEGQITIELPLIQLNPQSVPLPPLPYITLPNVPDISLAFSMPPIPVLPSLPEFPDLPELPPIPTLKLPTLPPPPKLPDLGKQFEVILPLVEKVLEIWCLVKKSLTPIPESMLEDQIRLLTNRPMYLTPLDLIKPQIQSPVLFDLGFNEIRIKTTVYLGIKVGMGIKDALQTASDEWGEWMDEIPKAMNKAYEKYMEGVATFQQEVIDKAGDAVNDAVDKAESAVQGGLDAAEKAAKEAMKDADDAMREAEDNMQKTFDEADMNEWADELKQKYANGLNDLNEDIADKFEEWKKSGFLEALSKIYLDKGKINEWFEGLSDDAKLGIFCYLGIEDCKMDFSKEEGEQFKSEAKIPDSKLTNPVILGLDPGVSDISKKSELKELLAQLVDEISKINNAELVPYTKLKKDFGLPDVEFDKQKDQADKLKEMNRQLVAYANDMEKEIEQIGRTNDISMLAEHNIKPIFPYQLVSDKHENDIITRTTTSATKNIENINFETKSISPKIEKAVKSAPLSSTESVFTTCDGVCLMDTELNREVSIIPDPESYKHFEMVFVKTEIKDKDNIIYNDGDSLYLKQNITLPVYQTINTPTQVPNKIIQFDDDFMADFGILNLMEAPNMLQTTLSENANSTFSWDTSTNPDFYGYGIELERTVTAHDDSKQISILPDTRIILLPQNEDGSTPEVYVDGEKLVSYNTLVTSWDDGKDDEIRDYFGIDEQNIITNAEEIVFNTAGGAMIKLRPHRAVYFVQYTKDSYSVKMKNGFYHIKMTWLDNKGNISTYGHDELISPQIYANTADPIVHPPKTFYTPVYKQKIIKATEVVTDLSGAYQYHWYDPISGIPIATNTDTLIIPPQKEPKEFSRKLIITKDINDPNFEQYEVDVKIMVYVPLIELEEYPLKIGSIKGTLKPHKKSPKDDLSTIPFSVFRKRWGVWKNLGKLNKNSDEPPHYYTVNHNGDYEIKNFDFTSPSPIILKNAKAEPVAKVIPGTGHVEILNADYEAKLMPATVILPTRIVIKSKTDDELIGNVYYTADGNTDIEILSESLTMKNVENIGVTIGDNIPNDDIIAKNIPGFAGSFPGGASIYNQTPPQKNIALISTTGNIRLMQSDYSLRIKSSDNRDDKYIFQIINPEGEPIFDVYVHANFDNLTIQQEEIMNDEDIKIGFENTLSSLIAASTPNTNNPFSDLDSSHPYFNSIINLYENRIISGYGDGSFRPNDKLSRAEFIKIALGVTNCFDCTMPTDSQRAKYMPTIPFPDVHLPAWYYFCIWIAKELGMITGYGDGYFRPARNISRAEASAVLLRQSSIEITEAPEGAFLDVPDYAWYKDYIYTAVEIGLIPEKLGFVFPDEEITRGEFAFMGTGVLNLQDCHDVDTDGDGIPDYLEMENNSDPLDAGEKPIDTSLSEIDTCPCSDNPNQNDTDNDGIIDVCDTDIDNDGKLNVICLFDNDGLVDPNKLAESEDNCVFVINKDQADSDFNIVGDLCEEDDMCPTIPEDEDGSDDQDGCPDIVDEIPEHEPGIHVAKGPDCTFIDYQSEIVDGDIIMTVITDIDTHEVIYSKSNEVIYTP